MIKSGTYITGKWTGNRFKVDRLLGQGANGEVYLVQTKAGYAAMKVCNEAADLALEWSVLQKLNQSSAIFPKPMLIDDDKDAQRYFYVMEWVLGEPMHKIWGKLTAEQANDVINQIASGLDELHQTSHAFCDIKPQNILVSLHSNVEVRFVDPGGITQFGRAVRQFTPYYDRAFWGLGTRRSEATYDLAGLTLALIISASAEPPSSIVSNDPEYRRAWLNKQVSRYFSSKHQQLIHAVLTGQLTNVKGFAREWERISQGNMTTRTHQKRTHVRHKSSPQTHRRQGMRGRDWTEWVMWTSLGTAAAFTLVAWATFFGWL
jgi:hypothetical protein